MRSTYALASATGLVLLASAGVANASIIPLAGNGAFGTYTGSVGYSALTATTGTLTLILTNTSPAPNGGFLTGVVVELPGTLAGSLASSTDADFVGLTAVSAAPFGSYDIGAATGGNWEGGGPPSRGIAIGDSVTLVWNIFGTGAGAFDVTDLNLTASGQPSIAVRFRGFGNGESDKVPALPAPGALVLAGMATALISRRQR